MYLFIYLCMHMKRFNSEGDALCLPIYLSINSYLSIHVYIYIYMYIINTWSFSFSYSDVVPAIESRSSSQRSSMAAFSPAPSRMMVSSLEIVT